MLKNMDSHSTLLLEERKAVQELQAHENKNLQLYGDL